MNCEYIDWHSCGINWYGCIFIIWIVLYQEDLVVLLWYNKFIKYRNIVFLYKNLLLSITEFLSDHCASTHWATIFEHLISGELSYTHINSWCYPTVCSEYVLVCYRCWWHKSLYYWRIHRERFNRWCNRTTTRTDARVGKLDWFLCKNIWLQRLVIK